jgi:hypothetical protein
MALLFQRSRVFVLLLVVASLTSGCAAIESVRLERAAQKTHMPALQRASSEQDLIGMARASRVFAEAATERRLRIYCADSRNASDYECLLRNDDPSDDRELIEVTGSRIQASDVVTNNQEAGVDEGDIVKKLGDRLIVLHAGTLHVIGLHEGQQETLALLDSLRIAVDSFGSSTWYDEILAAGDGVILLGYNWDQEVAELSVFALSPQGKLAHRGRYWIRVGDYFSGSNYGARIEGENLLLSLSTVLAETGTRWPMWSRRDVADPQWQSLVEPKDLYFPLAITPAPHAHLVLRCPLAALADTDLDCRVTGIVGGENSEFYASADAAYLAIREWDPKALLDPRFDADLADWDDSLADLRAHRYTAIYRLPYAEPDNVGVTRLEGIAGDQFSFKEDAHGLWAATTREIVPGHRELLLQRVERSAFGPSLGSRALEIARFEFSNKFPNFRFSEQALWVGSQWEFPPEEGAAGVLPPLIRQPLDGTRTQQIELPHSGEMIEPIGDRVLISGIDSQDRWGLSLMDDRSQAHRLSSLTSATHASSETRSHGFNRARLASGWVFGMPAVAVAAAELEETDSDLALFQVEADQLVAAGVLDMQHAFACATHCDEWYGEARIFFLGERIIALSGALMKEARLAGGRLVEVRQVALP